MLTAANFKFNFGDGVLYGYFSGDGLQALKIRDADEHGPVMHSSPDVVWEHTLHQLLDAYFAGVRVTFDGIPLDLAGGTVFQQRVWRATCGIPYGASTSYGRLAAAIGRPGASRAVGGALGANPVCLIVPCHRILAADGSLGGYTGGLHWKRRFLDIENQTNA